VSAVVPASVQQGRALENPRHGIEHLVDSRLFLVDEPATGAHSAATQNLTSLSRPEFSECVGVLSYARRLRPWISRRLAVRVH
jgi:hypothetical protein